MNRLLRITGIDALVSFYRYIYLNHPKLTTLAGIVLILGVGTIHVVETPTHFEAAIYLGVLFIVNAVGTLVPFTPQGAGVQQALLAKVFEGTAKASVVAAYSVGQQIAIGALTFGIGFASLVFIFRYRSFREVIARGQEERATSRSPREPRARG